MKKIQDFEFYRVLSMDDIEMTVEGEAYKEEWKDIEGYIGLFQVSSFGRIKSYPKVQNGNRGRIRKQGIDNRGYLRVCVGKDGVKNTFKVHRLVCEYFGERSVCMDEVNHFNGVKTCNHFLNLRWCTRIANMRHASEKNLLSKKFGSENPSTTLTNNEALEIFNSAGKLSEVARKYNVSIYNVSDIRRGKTWGHLTGKKYKPKRIIPEQLLKYID